MSEAIRPRRSVLYMPGSNARALDKARTLPCDAVILDLEDAVAPDAKEAARDGIAKALAEGSYGPRELVVRVNGPDTPFFRDDLAMAARSGADAVLVPKVSSAETVRDVGRALSEAGAPQALGLWAMIETPRAILDCAAIASAREDEPRLACFVMGTNDLAKETRARQVPGRTPMLAWLALAVAAARLHGLDILDGVHNALGDEAGLRAECEQGRDFGFDGKTLIHPNQIAIANEVFAPLAAEVEHGKAIIAAFDRPENAAKGVISLEGRMVERMHAEMARRTVALAEAIAARR